LTVLATGFGASSDYSEEDSCTFFLAATGFTTGDLTLATTFLGASSSLSSSDDSCLTGFLAGTAFLGTAISALSCLVGFFSTTGVSSSSDDSCLTTFLATFFSSTFSFLFLVAMMGMELSESSSESFINDALPQ
jgi:hypothetical protein